MQAFSVEQSILEGEQAVKELFQFVREHAVEADAYQMESTIFSRLQKIGLAAMKCYFAEKGTGDIGAELVLSEGLVLKRERALRGRDYFSVFGKLKVPRTCYRAVGHRGVMPLDAQANLPHRCYSYLLQEWMDLLSLRDGFGESSQSLEKLLGVNLNPSRLEVVNQESVIAHAYDQFYQQKDIPAFGSEGDVQVLSFDGKGVPVIKREAAKLQARLGRGEKPQKKKEAMVGVSYTIARHVRTPEEVAENLVYPERAKKRRAEQAEQVEQEQPGQQLTGAKPAVMNSSSVRAQNVRRLARLERPKQEVMQEMIRDAQRRNAEEQRPYVVVMDGALRLWNAVIALFVGVVWVGVLDIIHVVEYLVGCGPCRLWRDPVGGRTLGL